jgi:predicted phosphodiesterase
MLTWLHISDFHIKEGDAYDRNVVLAALLRSMATEMEAGWRPDLIFATGDIAHSGTPAEYEQASVFFDQLLKTTGIEKRRLFVIPGNHDVHRPSDRGLQRTLNSEEESIEFFGPRHPQYHFAKLRNYAEWHDKYFANVRRVAQRTTCQVERIEINGVPIGVLSMNSALFCLGDDDHGKLWIGRRALDPAIEALEAMRPYVRIGLVHHPLEWLHDEERSIIRKKLYDAVDCLLRGHLHESDVESTSNLANTVMHLAAGATYQTRKWPNRVLLVRLDTGARKLFIRPLRYEDQAPERWLDDVSVFPTQPDHIGTWNLALKSADRVSQTDGPQIGGVSVGGAATADKPVHIFFSEASFTESSAVAVVGCVVVEDVNAFSARLESARQDMLQDPALLEIPGVKETLRNKRLDYRLDDRDLKSRFIDVLSSTIFEGYVCFARQSPGSGVEREAVFDRLTQRLFYDRLRDNRTQTVRILVGSDLGQRREPIGRIVAATVKRIQREEPGSFVQPAQLPLAARDDLRAAAAEYLCEIARTRLEAPASVEARAFGRLYPAKIRVIYDLGTDTYYHRRHPFPTG